VSQTTDEIESQIEDKRADLRSNLEALESKVKSVADWRQHFQNHPGLLMAAAFGGGLLLAGMSGGPRGRRVRAAAGEGSSAAFAAGAQTSREVNQTWENIKGALIGLAATKIKDVLADRAPSFKQRVTETDRDKTVGAEVGPRAR